MSFDYLPAMAFVIALTIVCGLLGWGVGGPIGLVAGFWVGLIAADRITKVLERSR